VILNIITSLFCFFIFTLAGCQGDSTSKKEQDNKQNPPKEVSVEELVDDLPATAKAFSRLLLAFMIKEQEQKNENLKAEFEIDKLRAINVGDIAIDDYFKAERGNLLDTFKRECTGAQIQVLLERNSCKKEALLWSDAVACDEKHSLEGKMSGCYRDLGQKFA
jgi:hypothetical protein